MNQNLFLAPASTTGSAYSHLEKSVINGIETHSLEHFPNKNKDNISVWGISSGLKNTWDRAKSGDWILFYTGNNEYRYAAQIQDKEENSQLGSEIRDIHLEVTEREEKEEQEWNLLFYLGIPLSIELPAETLSEWLNYERAYRSRFQRVPKKRLQTIEGKYGTLEEMIMDFIVE
jgi:hypothetical protein